MVGKSSDEPTSELDPTRFYVGERAFLEVIGDGHLKLIYTSRDELVSNDVQIN